MLTKNGSKVAKKTFNDIDKIFTNVTKQLQNTKGIPFKTTVFTRILIELEKLDKNFNKDPIMNSISFVAFVYISDVVGLFNTSELKGKPASWLSPKGLKDYNRVFNSILSKINGKKSSTSVKVEELSSSSPRSVSKSASKTLMRGGSGNTRPVPSPRRSDKPTLRRSEKPTPTPRRLKPTPTRRRPSTIRRVQEVNPSNLNNSNTERTGPDSIARSQPFRFTGNPRPTRRLVSKKKRRASKEIKNPRPKKLVKNQQKSASSSSSSS